MKVRIGFALVVLLLIGTAAHGQEVHNGYWWVDEPASFKLGFATGYAMAMTGAADAAAFKCLADKYGGTVPQKYTGNEALTACYQTTEVASLTYSNLRIGQLVDGADEFYKDFRNKNLGIELAMRYVRDALKGKTDKELADELAGWRLSANK